MNSLNAVPIRRIYERWGSRLEDLWANHLVRLKESIEQGGPDPSPQPKD